MKKCDFLLTYEIRNREIENICLVKRELERRGYSVIIEEQYRTFFDVPEPIEAKVIAIPAFYRDRAMFYTASHVKTASRILNFQWEQISTDSRSQKGGLASIKPWGFGALHLSWGEDNLNRLVNTYGVPQKHVCLTGHIGMDFLRPELRKYYYSREEICNKFNIPLDKEICLFISSFVLTDITDRVFETSSANDTERAAVSEHQRESIESHRIILDWFDRLLSDNNDKVLIYRPHPEEKNRAVLDSLMKKHKNFYVINDLSVKQWILVSDKILTWVSTSIAEVYFSGKTCLVLQPIRSSMNTTLFIYKHANTISSYTEFTEALRKDELLFPIPKEDMEHYYWRSENRFSYEIVCDALEHVLKDDEYLLTEPLKNPFSGLFNKERFYCFVKRFISNSRICNMIHSKDKMKGTKIRKNIDDILYVKEKLEKNHVTKKEIDDIISRINNAFAVGDK